MDARQLRLGVHMQFGRCGRYSRFEIPRPNIRYAARRATQQFAFATFTSAPLMLAGVVRASEYAASPPEGALAAHNSVRHGYGAPNGETFARPPTAIGLY
ncbi:hypothetical protein EVAR_41350_1 [Eumeta japonica]|uniref:Uncharacterized protein n=1 Tax=Eumeta variegata TaxID=151549 RepID=A0A4C1XRU6_EUMVA|nr:hypothetical protein EVAR_41350_1 [Eumeta japonica]